MEKTLIGAYLTLTLTRSSAHVLTTLTAKSLTSLSSPITKDTQGALAVKYLNLVLRKQRHKTSTDNYATQLPRCTSPLLAPAWRFPEPTAETRQRKRSKQKYSRPQDTLHKVVHAPK